MRLTTHAAAGVLIGTLSPDPIAAFSAGFVSHFFLDMVPHEKSEDLILEYPDHQIRNSTVVKRRTFFSIFDLFFTAVIVIIAWFLSARKPDSMGIFWVLLSGIIGGLLPDCVVILTFFLDNRFMRLYFKFHVKIHFIFSSVSVSNFVSILYQIILICIFITASIFILH